MVGALSAGLASTQHKSRETDMTALPLNTFAAACYDQNSIKELEQALKNGPDRTDMRAWGIETDEEYYAQIRMALDAKKADEAE